MLRLISETMYADRNQVQNMTCKLIRLVVMGLMILAGFSLVATDDKVVIPVGLV